MPISRPPKPDGSTRRTVSGRSAAKTTSAPSSPSATSVSAEAPTGSARTIAARRVRFTGPPLKPVVTSSATDPHLARDLARRAGTTFPKEEGTMTTSTTHRTRRTLATLAAGALLAISGTGAAAPRPKLPTRSTSIALYRNDARLLVANREADSLSVFVVRRRGADVSQKLAEVTVGREPRCVALGPKEREAYVVNGASGTVSVVSLVGERAHEVVAELAVGTEPRGCATTPSGRRLFVANYTEGTVSVIDTKTRTVLGKVPVGGNPFAVAVTNDGDRNDDDE